jgi:hypothetical protein
MPHQQERKIDMHELEKQIADSILYGFEGKIRSVKNITELGTFEYTPENARMIAAILTTGNYSKLSTLQRAENLLGDDLTVFRFSDGEDRLYYGYYFDSIELSQYPEVLEIFPEVPMKGT